MENKTETIALINTYTPKSILEIFMELSSKGYNVLLCSSGITLNVGISDAQRQLMYSNDKKKIEMSDYVYVSNAVDDLLCDNDFKLILYAREIGKPIKFSEPFISVDTWKNLMATFGFKPNDMIFDNLYLKDMLITPLSKVNPDDVYQDTFIQYVRLIKEGEPHEQT